MKTPILICAVPLLAAFGLQATPVDPGCTQASFATYEVSGFTCTIGDKTFSNFNFFDNAGGGAIPVTADEITVMPVAPIPGQTPTWGFTFGGVPLVAGPGQSNDITIQYNEAVTTGPMLIDSAEMSFAGGASSGGAASVAETLCLGTTYQNCVNPISLFAAFPTAGASTTFAPVAILGVTKDIDVSGLAGGMATISSWTNTVDQTGVPEPGFYGVLAAGMGAVLMFARRRKKTA